jgi:hypothetical protein
MAATLVLMSSTPEDSGIEVLSSEPDYPLFAERYTGRADVLPLD